MVAPNSTEKFASFVSPSCNVNIQAGQVDTCSVDELGGEGGERRRKDSGASEQEEQEVSTRDQRVLDTRLELRFFSYSNLTRTKHFSDRVVSSINSRNFRIISTNIQKHSSMKKMIGPEWASSMRRTLSLSFKSWEESLLVLNPLLFSIQHFPFLSDLVRKRNSWANFELF